MACYPGQPALHQSVEDPREKSGLGFEVDQSLPLKSHSTQAIVRWLEDTYQYEDCICLPRSTIYEHYSDFCMRNQLQPVNAASFGKIIRQQFPTLTTRRLGTRGQSKYHYYGLGIKPTSVYYTEDYVQKQHNQGVPKKEPEAKKSHAYYAGKERPSAVLPKFPEVKHLTMSGSLPKEKLMTFMVMYRAHCQRILDSVIRANFDEVENFLFHFWQGMPSHLMSVLGTELVVDLVAVCDMALYKAVVSIYIATPLQNLPDNVAQEVRRFTTNLKCWLEPALQDLPESLVAVKLKAADMLCKSFKRQRSLMHLADAARNAFKGGESIEQLESDWGGLNLQTIFAQTLYTIQPLNIPQCYLDMVPNFLAEFSCMFSDEKCSLEDFALWIEAVMHNCFKDLKKGSIKTAGRAFLLTWKFFTSKIVREFTLMSAPSFGTFHLLHMLVDDYIMHTLETMLEKEHQDSHMKRINLLKQDDADEDIQVADTLLPSSSSSTTKSSEPPLQPPANPMPIPMPLKYTDFNSTDFKHTAAQDRHTTATPTTGVLVVGGGGVIGGGGGGGGDVAVPGKARKGDPYSSSDLPHQGFHSSGGMMRNLPVPLGRPSMGGLGGGLSSQPPSTNTESTFQGILPSSQDTVNMQQSNQALGLTRYSVTDADSGRIRGPAKSLSHPNLSAIGPPSRRGGVASIAAHSQAPPIPFPANLGGFTLSSMVGHFTPHPQLQPQALSMNPAAAGGLMQGLGISVGGPGPHPTSISLVQQQSLSGMPPTTTTLPPPMPLTHTVASSLHNPGGLPPLMQTMYSYPYMATLPAQPASTASSINNAPLPTATGFPPQSLLPGYSQYVPPSYAGTILNNHPSAQATSLGNNTYNRQET